jgi:hypothetical protein
VDNPDAEWAAPLAAVVLGAVGAVALLVVVVLGSLDGPGRLLLGVAAVAVGVAAVFGLRARPRLAATDDSLTVRGLLGARTWPWTRVDAVRVVRMRRLGMPAAYLEIDARDDDGAERLLVLGRLELGTDPVDVAEALQAHRARAGRGGTGSAADAAGGGAADDAAEGRVAQRDRDDEGEDDPRDDPQADDRA